MTELTINGKVHRLDLDVSRTLLSVLREELGMTGAKYGCGEAQCGACTVLIDGRARRSCVTPLGDAAGRRVITIEGLETEGRLHPLQQAFLETDALQCGYCTPGMILASLSLLHRKPEPDDAAIRKALEGNICRCGLYRRILAAVRLAAGRLKSAPTSKPTA